MDNLNDIAEACRSALEVKNAERERLINVSRVLIRHCANAIRAIHRQEWAGARELIGTAAVTVAEMTAVAAQHPDLYHAGYTQDSIKEYVEAAATYALVRGETLPTPAQLGVEVATYLNGLAEASTELRRYILDILRHEHSEEAERLLA
ncbi:MAG TPA: hypothetical protein VMT34_08915, partial [Aggregatilineales bacterium]|nr:hypothetical protein [Aggregatilineales bacterium]